MSDRVTNVEIEDVLSSIRRLVSEAAPVPRQPAKADTAATVPASAPPHPAVGKLLLTEAHRVAPPETATELPDAAGATSDDLADDVPDRVADALPGSTPPADLLGESSIILDLPFAFRSAAQSPVTADYSTHIPTDDPASDDAMAGDTATDAIPPADIAADLAEIAEHDQPDDGTDGDDVPDDPLDGIDLRSIDPGQRLSDTVAGLEVATHRAADDWEPDGSEGVPVMDWAAAAEQAEEGPVPIFRSRKPPPLRLSPDLAVPPEPAGPPEPAAQQGAAVLPFQSDRHRAPGDSPGDLSRDLSGLDAQDRETGGDDASDAAIMAALRDANGVNEALLRELVLEIVRQELQGALGERITRNVRKLVRREIYRVLNEAEQD